MNSSINLPTRFNLLLTVAGDLRELALAELRALLDIYGKEVKLKHAFNKVLLQDVDPALYQLIYQRAALTKLALLHHGTLCLVRDPEHEQIASQDQEENPEEICTGPHFKPNDETLQELAEFVNLHPSETPSFRVRAKRSFSTYKTLWTLPYLERKVGSYLYLKTPGIRVDLTHPSREIQVHVDPGMLSIGTKLFERPRTTFDSRAPHHREFYKPGAMRPEIARVMVNLSRVKAGESFFDPFGGTGGLVLEAIDMGIYGFVGELERFSAVGAKQNLRNLPARPEFTSSFSELQSETHPEMQAVSAGQPCYEAIVASATHVPFHHLDAIACDPPYQISTSTFGKELKHLIEEVLHQAKLTLKKGKCLCMSLPHHFPLEEWMSKHGFTIIEVVTQRVHSALVRKFVVGLYDA